MELLLLLPSSYLLPVINSILAIGVISTLFTFIVLDKISPVLTGYNTLFKIISIIVLLFGVYTKGGYTTEQIWREKLSKVENELKIANEKSTSANALINQTVVTEIKEVKVKGADIIKYVNREVVKYNNTCVIPQSVVNAHNAAASNSPIQEN